MRNAQVTVLQFGQTHRGIRLAYETYGTLNADESNAIVWMTLFGAHHNASRWPRLTMTDNVHLQCRLILEELGIDQGALAGGIRWATSQNGLSAIHARAPRMPSAALKVVPSDWGHRAGRRLLHRSGAGIGRCLRHRRARRQGGGGVAALQPDIFARAHRRQRPGRHARHDRFARTGIPACDGPLWAGGRPEGRALPASPHRPGQAFVHAAAGLPRICRQAGGETSGNGHTVLPHQNARVPT